MTTDNLERPDPILTDPPGTADERFPAPELAPRAKLGQRIRHETHVCGGTISLSGAAAWDHSSRWAATSADTPPVETCSGPDPEHRPPRGRQSAHSEHTIVRASASRLRWCTR